MLLLALLVAGAGGWRSVAVEPISRPPNIVLILGDDHGWPYAGFMGDRIVETPNLDALAAQGTVFTQVFASASVCQPSLQTLLTGLHPDRWSAQQARLEESLGPGFDPWHVVVHFETLPRQLRRRGYRSFEGGKHWEGTFRLAGFDAGTAKKQGGMFAVDGADDFGRPSIDPMLEFLDDGAGEPFFLWVAPMLPHTPLDPPEELRARYEGRGLTPDAVLYYANVTRLDEVVGRVVAALDDRGLRDETLIVYVSDNGWEQAPDRTHFLGPKLGGPRGKMSIYELGHRSPAIFNWPGHVPVGRRVEDLAGFEDLHATFLDYAGAPAPPDHQGLSLRERIEGRGEPARDRIFGLMRNLRVRESEALPDRPFVARELAAYVRTQSWRYVAYLERDEHELYRIDEDPFEDSDVAASHPEVVATLAAELEAWLAGLSRPAPWTDLSGELHQVMGPGLPGVTLHLQGSAEDGSAIDFQVATAENGSFRFPNVPAGHYTLRLSQGVLVHGQETQEALSVDLRGATTAPYLYLGTLEAQLPPPGPTGRGEVSGRVSSREGQPVAGIPVELHGWTPDGRFTARVATGPDGSFLVDHVPEGFHLQWLRPPRGCSAVTPFRLGVDERARSGLEVRPHCLQGP